MVSSPYITFVACNRNAALFRNDPSFVYRCENPGLALKDQNLQIKLTHQSTLDQNQPQYAVVFHRPLASFQLWRQIHRLRRQGVVVIADVDDLVFDSAYTDYSPGVLNGQVSKRVTSKRFRLHQRAFSWCDGITVSTAPLAIHLSKLFSKKPVEVIPNCIHHSWRKVSHYKSSSGQEKILTYFPGTRSHNRDFALIKAPLTKFLLSNPEVKLQITGPLDFDLQVHEKQVNHQERVPYDEYQAQFRSSWVNLAPLEETPFNQCKSALKVIEAGYWGIPTLCSHNPDFQRFEHAGALIAKKDNEWLAHLENLLDPIEYRKTTDILSDRTIQIADINEQASRYMSFFQSLEKRTVR